MVITLKELVQREVIYCVSSLIYTLTQENKLDEEIAISLWQGIIDYEAAEYAINQDGSYLVEKEGLWGLYDNDDLDNPIVDYDYETKEELIEWYFDDMSWDIENYRFEVFEHWLVSNWLSKELDAHREVTVECYGLTIWCRTTTGQAIHCDSVMEQIYQELMKLK